jgi:hypothetical protein
MEKLVTEGGKKTPTIYFDPDKRELRFEGRSIPEDTISFYEPILKWIENMLKPNEKIQLTCILILNISIPALPDIFLVS